MPSIFFLHAALGETCKTHQTKPSQVAYSATPKCPICDPSPTRMPWRPNEPAPLPTRTVVMEGQTVVSCAAGKDMRPASLTTLTLPQPFFSLSCLPKGRCREPWRVLLSRCLPCLSVCLSELDWEFPFSNQILIPAAKNQIPTKPRFLQQGQDPAVEWSCSDAMVQELTQPPRLLALGPAWSWSLALWCWMESGSRAQKHPLPGATSPSASESPFKSRRDFGELERKGPDDN